MSNVIVCGGRNYTKKSVLKRVLACEICATDTIVCGDAPGADTLAWQWAEARGGEVRRFPANWSLYGRAAGPIRNQQMLDETAPRLVIAFPGGRGTADMVRRAELAGVKVIKVSDA